MDAGHEPRVGDTGDLAETPLPGLLIDLYRSRYSGALELVRAKTNKRIVFQQGAPVLSESNVASETLGVQLVDQGTLDRDDHQRVSAYMERKQCREGVALLALELLEPKNLFLALKEQVRRRVLEVFGWSDGSYRLVETDDLQSEIQPLRSDPLAIVREGLVNHWTPDRLLADLTEQVELFPVRTKTFDEAQRRLTDDEELSALFDRIDGTQTLAAAIATAFNSSPVLATIWILARGQFIRFEPTAFGSESEDAANSFSADIEIEVVAKDRPRTSEDKEPAGTPTAAAGANSDAEDATEAMRQEVLELLDDLEQHSFYDLLGIEEDATDGQVRKAYFSAAKRFHPDALTHLGLSDIKEQAATVFARIAEANDVLRDPAARAAYDARAGADEPAVDTHALAQAETFYRKGEILIRMGDFRGSLEYLEPAVELWPDECEYQSLLGWALYKQPKADCERSLVHLERAAELDASNAVALFRLGTVLRASGDEERGAEYLARARMVDPEVS